MTKPKLNQPRDMVFNQKRDLFQTPNYATKLLIPFIPSNIKTIWEVSCGDYKISKVLEKFGYVLINHDLKYGQNFLFGDKIELDKKSFAIITNPPYSLKKEFYKKCLSYEIPFSLLLPTDYCGWIIDAIRIDGCEKIIPTRRIDYITPNNKEKSTAQFHSMWLTFGFNLGRTETFVELTNEMKRDI